MNIWDYLQRRYELTEQRKRIMNGDFTGGRERQPLLSPARISAPEPTVPTTQYVQQPPTVADDQQSRQPIPFDSAQYNTGPQPTVTPRRTLQEVSDQIRQLSNPDDPDFEPVRDNDKSFWKKLASVGREFVISAGNAYGESAKYARYMTPAERLAGSIGAGIASSAYEGIAGTADETRQRYYDIARLRGEQAEIETEQQQQAKQYKDHLDMLDKLQDLQLNNPVPVVDPVTGETRWVKPDQAYQQGNLNLRQATSLAHQAEQGQLNRTSRENIAATAREQQLEVKRAEIQNAADKFNTQTAISAEKDYTRRIDDWTKRQAERALQLARLVGETGAGATEVQQYAGTVANNAALIQQLVSAAEAEPNLARRAQLERRIDMHLRQIDSAQNRIAKTLGKVDKNASVVEFLKSQAEPRPQKPKLPTYKPTLPQGRKVSSSRDPLGLFR